MAEQIKEYSLFIASEQSWEKLPLTPLGSDCFRLEVNSLAVKGLFYHDIIEAEPTIEAKPYEEDGLRFMRLVERSGLRTFFFVLSQEVTGSKAFENFLQRVEAHGGHWEQVFGGVLLINLPRGSACRPKSELRAIYQLFSKSASSRE